MQNSSHSGHHDISSAEAQEVLEILGNLSDELRRTRVKPWEAFGKMDKDKSRDLDTHEFTEFLHDMQDRKGKRLFSLKKAERLCRFLDTNHDGSVDFREFVRAVQLYRRHQRAGTLHLWQGAYVHDPVHTEAENLFPEWLKEDAGFRAIFTRYNTREYRAMRATEKKIYEDDSEEDSPNRRRPRRRPSSCIVDESLDGHSQVSVPSKVLVGFGNMLKKATVDDQDEEEGVDDIVLLILAAGKGAYMRTSEDKLRIASWLKHHLLDHLEDTEEKFNLQQLSLLTKHVEMLSPRAKEIFLDSGDGYDECCYLVVKGHVHLTMDEEESLGTTVLPGAIFGGARVLERLQQSRHPGAAGGGGGNAPGGGGAGAGGAGGAAAADPRRTLRPTPAPGALPPSRSTAAAAAAAAAGEEGEGGFRPGTAAQGRAAAARRSRPRAQAGREGAVVFQLTLFAVERWLSDLNIKQSETAVRIVQKLFSDLSFSKLSWLGGECVFQNFENGQETIFMEGDPADRVYFVVKGQVSLTKDTEISDGNAWPVENGHIEKVTHTKQLQVKLAVFGPGDFFGEEFLRKPAATAAVGASSAGGGSGVGTPHQRPCRAYTATASNNTQVFWLARAALRRVLAGREPGAADPFGDPARAHLYKAAATLRAEVLERRRAERNYKKLKDSVLGENYLRRKNNVGQKPPLKSSTSAADRGLSHLPSQDFQRGGGAGTARRSAAALGTAREGSATRGGGGGGGGGTTARGTMRRGTAAAAVPRPSRGVVADGAQRGGFGRRGRQRNLTTPDGNKDWEQLPAGERRNRAHSSLDGGMTAREVEMGISQGGKKRPVLRRLKSWDTNGGGASGLLVYNSQGKEVSLPSSLPALLCQDPQDNTMKHSMLKLVGGTALLRAAESSEILDVHQSGMETRVDLVATTARGGRKKSARAPIPSLYQSDISSTGKRPPTKTLFLSPIQRDKPLSGFGPDIDDGGSLQPQRVGSLPVMVDATNGVLVATTKHEEKGEDVTVNMMVPLY